MAKFDTDKIRRENPVDEIARQYGVKLIRDGQEFKACCPFHKERTPSFTIFTGRDGVRRYWCHGCGANGDGIDFVQEWHGITFSAACEILGGKRDAPETKREAGPPPEAYDPYAGYKVVMPPKDAPAILAGKRSPALLNPKRLDAKGKPKLVTYSPSMVFPYTDKDGRLIGYVLRVDLGEGRKVTPAILWMKNAATGFSGWSHGRMPEPRPPYRVQDLYRDPGRQVLVVEGEKSADAGAALTDRVVTISWLGGSKSAAKTNWGHLIGRRVVVWMDNDDAGENAVLGWFDHKGREWHKGVCELILDAGAAAVKAIGRNKDKPKGWDVFDAVEDDKMSAAAVLAYGKDRAFDVTREYIQERRDSLTKQPPDPEREEPKPKPAAKPTTQEKPKPAKAQEPPPAGRESRGNVVSLRGPLIPPPEDFEDWRANLITNDEGKLKPKLNNNFIWMLRGHEDMRGVFGWNELAAECFLIRRPPWDRGKSVWTPRRMTKEDVYQTLVWLERKYLTPREGEVLSAILDSSKRYAFHPIRHYLEGLEWDGCPRIQGGMWEGASMDPFAVEYLGSPPKWIFSTFATRWFVSAVARIMRPGAKADAMIVLEGEQYTGKSTMLRTLSTINGEAYFTDSIGDITNRQSVMQLHGVWIVEVAELSGFDRKETNAIKAWLSRPTDRYVPPYGRVAEDSPRQFIVAGSINPSGHGYLRDPTGARRFWPLPVRKVIDLEQIERDREQLWAEAMHLFRKGTPWHLTHLEVAEARTITDERQEEDPWQYVLEARIAGQTEVWIGDLLTDLNIPRGQQTTLTIKRISEFLASRGFKRERKRRGLVGEKTTVWTRSEGVDD